MEICYFMILTGWLRYDIYGTNFLEYIDDMSKCPGRMGNEYLQKMQLSFNTVREKLYSKMQ